MTAVPLSATTGAAVVLPGIVVVDGGSEIPLGGITGALNDGGTLTVDGSVGGTSVRVTGTFAARFALARRATFTLLSSFDPRNRKKNTSPSSTTAPIIAGMAQGGKPSSRRRTTATGGSGATSGRPQFGHATAFAETS